MPTTVTNEIAVSVETAFQPGYGTTRSGEYMFSYHINIFNNSGYAVQLLRRHWYIVDSNGERREVEGEGVVGLQPVMEPGTGHEYSSACNLKTEIGKMYGSYLFERLADGLKFSVEIPEFKMFASYRMN